MFPMCLLSGCQHGFSVTVNWGTFVGINFKLRAGAYLVILSWKQGLIW